MKRFYKMVSIEPAAEQEAVHHILLDGRPVKTQSGARLLVPNETIAHQVMEEWANQEDEIDPDTMPLTQILNTAIDHVPLQRGAMAQNVLRYLDTDLLCYLAEKPEALVEAQEKVWGPWREWFGQEFGTPLKTTSGLAALKQDQKAHDALTQYVNNLGDMHFTVLQLVTPLSGSVIMAAAFVEERARPDDVIAAAFVEEDFKDSLYDADKYGADPLIEKSKKAAHTDLSAAQHILKALRS